MIIFFAKYEINFTKLPFTFFAYKKRIRKIRFVLLFQGSTLNADEPADASTFQLENLSNDGPSSLATAAKPLSVFGI